MRRMDVGLVGQLRHALRHRQHARQLLGGELKLSDGGREQPLARRIKLVTWAWPVLGLGRSCNEGFIRLTAPAAPMGYALLGTGVRGFNDEVGRERCLKRCRMTSPRNRWRTR